MKKLAPLPLEDIISASHSFAQPSNSKQIQHKRDLIDAVRRTNPATVNSAPSVFWNVEGNLKTGAIDDSGLKQQINIVESGVNQSARRYNDLRAANELLTKELKQKLDRLNDEKKNYEALDAMRKSETDEGRRIELLNEEIDRVERDLFDKNHYTRQLEHMLGRLKANQLRFDAHMTGMQEVMTSIKKEEAEVKLMRRALDAGLAKAVAVLDTTQQNLNNARKDREIAIAQRRREYENAQMLEKWMHERELEKEALAKELRGELTKEEEAFLRSQIVSKAEKIRHLQRANEECNQRFLAMEEAFSKLKQVTGVSSLVDMHEKFSSQKGNKGNLLQEVRDAESRLEAVKQTQARLEETFHELRSSGGAGTGSSVGIIGSGGGGAGAGGVGGSAGNDKTPSAADKGMAALSAVLTAVQNPASSSISALEDAARDSDEHLEATINAAKNDCKVARAASERLSAVLLGIQQGARGLRSRVQPFEHLTSDAVFDLAQVADDSQPWADALENLSVAEQVLSKMMEVLSGVAEGASSPSKWMAAALDEEQEDEMSIDSQSVGTAGEAPAYAYNVRIKSKRALREGEQKLLQKSESDAAAAATAPSKGAPSTKDKGDKEKDPQSFAAEDEEDVELDVTAMPSHGAFGTAGTGAGGVAQQHSRGTANTRGGRPVSPEEGLPAKLMAVPTRLTVKKASLRAQQEAKRKADIEIRTKRLNERMKKLEEGHKAKASGDDSAIGNLAMLRAQQATAERLSSAHRPATLPDGVSLRDDPMTKTKAFLAALPSLD